MNNMNGTFFVLSPNGAQTSLDGLYLSHYNDTWVLAQFPRLLGNVWAVGIDLVAMDFRIASAPISGIASAKVVEANIVGAFYDFVAEHRTSTTDDTAQRFFFRYRNIDGIPSTENYSINNSGDWTSSILGSYDNGQTYLERFNNSVMLYNEPFGGLRMNILGNSIVSYSFAVMPDKIGTILIPFGDTPQDYFPHKYTENDKQYIISKNGTGFIRVTRLGIDVPNRIERMAQFIYRINTVDVVNILVEQGSRISAENGSLDWNNKFRIINNIQGNNAQTFNMHHVNSAYNPQPEITGLRSSSMIISDTSFDLYGYIFNDPLPNGYTLEFVNAGLSREGIDVYFDTIQPSKYRYSIVNGVQIFNSLFKDLSFPLGVIVPFPLGTEWNMHSEVIAVGKISLDLFTQGNTFNNRTLDTYIFSNQIFFGNTAFDLFGVMYIFDGSFIYQGDDRIVIALGYMFVGSNNQQAFFYNPWDKSVYQFTGSRNLNKILSLTNRLPVKAGRYDGFADEMIFLTDDEILKNRGDVIMNFPYPPGEVIIPTVEGAYIQLADGSRQLLSPLNGDVDIFDLETSFIGVDGSTVCDYERVDVRLYSPGRTSLNFTVELQTINQDTKESEMKQITLKGNDWSLDGYKTIKLIPKFKKGTGLALRITSKQEIFIAEIEFTYDPVSRTANSQRSGF